MNADVARTAFHREPCDGLPVVTFEALRKPEYAGQDAGFFPLLPI